MTDTGSGYIQCLTNDDCDLMVKILPANRVAEVYITHGGNVSKIQNQVSPNANYICEDNGVQIDLKVLKDGAYNHISKSAEISINLDDFELERANYGGDKNSDVYQELEQRVECTRKDKAAMKLKGKEIMKRKEDKKKNLAGNGEVSVKGRKEGKEKKKDKVMEKAKSANFTGLLLENSSTESENDNISPKYDSDDMCSINSDDDEKVRKVENVAFRAETDMDNPTFRMNLIKISAKCCDQCPWRIYASKKAPDDPTITIKTLVGKHSDDCLFVYVNKNVKSRMIAKTFLHYLRIHPDVSVGDFMDKIHEEMNVEVSVSQVYRAKTIAKEMIEGLYIEQYAKLEDYCAELKRKNPGSTVLLETTPHEEDDRPVFERIYICLEPCRRGWMEDCRPLIRMDGCFL
nr:uncharacterized protein LOC117275717 [Nicotiana tomentosiformis]